MTHLLESLRVNQERAECFIALGKVAMAVGTKIKPYVKQVLEMVKLGLGSGAASGAAAASGEEKKLSSFLFLKQKKKQLFVVTRNSSSFNIVLKHSLVLPCLPRVFPMI